MARDKKFQIQLENLAKLAWMSRGTALGKTKVGCALITVDGKIHSGCNFEHRFHKSIHAEISAICDMVSNRDLTSSNQRPQIDMIVIVAATTKFTPCGDCLDWINQFADAHNCFVGFQNDPKDEIKIWRLIELMPEYPEF
jgi:cytidine deaminase